MAEANEALLKFSVDVNEVNREIQRALKGATDINFVGGGGSPASGGAASGGGGGRSGAASGGGGAGGGLAGMVAGGTPVGMAMSGFRYALERVDAINNRRNAYTTAQITSFNQANAGLITGATEQRQMMQAGMKNAMGIWGGIPILSGELEARMKQDPRYQSFMTEVQKQQNIDADIVGSVTGFYSRARAEGYKPSTQEMERIADVSQALAKEKQQVREFANKYTQNRDDNVSLAAKKEGFLNDVSGTKILKEAFEEKLDQLKTLISTDVLSAIRSAVGG